MMFFKLLVILCIAVVLSVARPVTGNLTASKDPLLWSHVVVRGEITSVSRSVTSLDKWFDGPTDVMRADVRSTLTMLVRVDEVLRGVYDSANLELDIFVMRDSVHVEKGDIIIAAANYQRKAGRYLIERLEDLYKLDNGVWVCQGRRFGEVSTENIKKRIEAAKIERITDEAEAVVRGELTGKRIKAIRGPNGEPAEYQEYTISVKSVLKGDITGDEVTFGAIIRGGFWAPWRVPMTRGYVKGDELFVFLKKGDYGWYAFAGKNGVLKVRGDSLIYDLSVPYERTKSDVENILMRSREQ